MQMKRFSNFTKQIGIENLTGILREQLDTFETVSLKFLILLICHYQVSRYQAT